MTEEPVTFVALAVATVTIPPATCDTPPGTHLVGAGLLIATRCADRWRFSCEAGTIAAGEKEQNLLLWLSNRLPMADTLIGWQIDQHIVPPLIDAAAHAEPTIAHHFMVRLARVLRNNVVDLSINRSAAPENLATAPSMMPDTLLGNWGTGRLDAVRADLATEAIGTWLHFLQQAQHVGADAEQATRAWMHRRSSIHLVEKAPGAA
ncbi:hypothetical protein [Sphingobium limneticum]|uniref:3'-5' exonuclease n=1 Tax=Sphingobium limneticum TaxID=1007511 RepID=A0A5J5I3B7_9SPHN|nr:hypothetical protein [Sphingobium limneticum]KAA9016887.1 hypothetical protein F4U96_11720 [Sphingobium limneticum]KAA9029866.1 hypothetical protein F4U95_11665 [Sphingobium limneticum]